MQGEGRLWSVNRLAGELDMDRRTIARRLRDVPADGRLRGHPAWHLATALRALDWDRHVRRNGAATREQRPMPACLVPFGGRLTADENPVAEGMASALIGLVQDVPRIAASVAVGVGAPLEVAHALFGSVAVALAGYADKEMEKCGLAWSIDDHFYMPLEPDWAALARMAGEVVDKKAL